MLISILIDVQYLQNIVFSFEGGSNGQNQSSSGSHHLIKKFPSQQHFWFPPVGGIPPLPFNTFKNPKWKKNSRLNLNVWGQTWTGMLKYGNYCWGGPRLSHGFSCVKNSLKRKSGVFPTCYKGSKCCFYFFVLFLAERISHDPDISNISRINW